MSRTTVPSREPSRACWGASIRYRLLAAALVLSGGILLLWTANPERSARAQGLRETAHVLETLSHGTPEAWVASFHTDSMPPSLDAAQKWQAHVREHLGAFVALRDASCTVIENRDTYRGRTVKLVLRVRGVAQFEKGTADVDLALREGALYHFKIRSSAFPKRAAWRDLADPTHIAAGASVLRELLSPPTDDDDARTSALSSEQARSDARMHAGNATAVLGTPVDIACIFAERLDQQPGQLRLRYALTGANRSGLAHVTITTAPLPYEIVGVRFEIDGSR